MESRNRVIPVRLQSKDAAVRLVGGHDKIREVFTIDKGECLQLVRNKLRELLNDESALELPRVLDRVLLAVT